MTSIKCLLVSICLVTVQASTDDPGPYKFEQSSPTAAPSSDRGYVMKEVTLYLTPSQIRALEASQAEKSQKQSQSVSEQDLEKLDAEIKRQLEQQHIFYYKDQSDVQKPASNLHNAPPPVEEPANENAADFLPKFQQSWTPIPKISDDLKYFAPLEKLNQQNPNTKFPESYSFIKIYTDEKVHETPKLQLFHPIPHQHPDNDELSKLFEVQQDPLHKKQYKLVPYEYLPDYSPEAPKPEEVKEISKFVTEFDKYESPYNRKPSNPQVTEDNQEETATQKDDSYYQKYTPSIEDHKQSAEYQKFVLKLEKENALAKAQAILKSPPVVIRKEVTTKRRPIIGGIRHVSIIPSLPTEKPILRHGWKH
ncbi:uncharacterized protein LOC114352849 [Ostrinia furnacalis]|uniref:uncharacterized protein LOC114352849 n=1 Tax=Ostrinia furnacalis TaxID=93504 RepID=UPI001038ADF1|nr:uncharacterized protein LOC114352849 [Ostrinia furnacalis]